MDKLKLILTCFLLFCTTILFAQVDTVLYFKGAIKQNRIKHQQNLVKNTITKNLSLPLSDSTESNWQDAFWAMELMQYSSPWTDNRVQLSFDSIEKRSTDFQRSLLELVYANYPSTFYSAVDHFAHTTSNKKIFVTCLEYLLQANPAKPISKDLLEKLVTSSIADDSDPIINQALYHFSNEEKLKPKNIIAQVLKNNFLPKNVILYSFQRKNRNYPGLAIVRDTNGIFIKDSGGNYFSVPQLARSVSNMPGYLTNGNTAQGIYRMHGFDVSKASYIGPTPNIQLTMPFETSIRHFLKDSTIVDSVWTEEYYKKLLPEKLKNYFPLYQTYYASKIGRTEIIAHGTTIDPEYYKGKTYYPLTPTQGCLCSKEIWSAENGILLESDQYKLIKAITTAGGPDGYCIVIEIDDQQKPVSLEEILSYLKK